MRSDSRRRDYIRSTLRLGDSTESARLSNWGELSQRGARTRAALVRRTWRSNYRPPERPSIVVQARRRCVVLRPRIERGSSKPRCSIHATNRAAAYWSAPAKLSSFANAHTRVPQSGSCRHPLRTFAPFRPSPAYPAPPGSGTRRRTRRRTECLSCVRPTNGAYVSIYRRAGRGMVRSVAARYSRRSCLPPDAAPRIKIDR